MVIESSIISQTILNIDSIVNILYQTGRKRISNCNSPRGRGPGGQAPSEVAGKEPRLPLHDGSGAPSKTLPGAKRLIIGDGVTSIPAAESRRAGARRARHCQVAAQTCGEPY